MPLLDLVICTYDNARLLDATLASVGAQKDLSGIGEVVVVDNNCTDDTREVVARYARAGVVPVRVVAETRQGLTPARVRGVTSTSAPWIAFVDDDCLLADDWAGQAVRFAAEHPECGAFGGRVTLEWEVPPPRYVLRHRYAYAGKQHGEVAHRRPWLAGIGMVVRREALERSGWIDEQFLDDRIGRRLVSGGDMEIALRLAAGHELWYNPACRLRHVIPARRMTREYLKRMQAGLGASRHNAEALRWRGSYRTWFLYSVIASIGVAVLGIPALRGWWSAMWGMYKMDPSVRRRLVGCARLDLC
ncbi:MAG TPA: glycosyltransferase [Thermoanaerobaculia bacterium]|nr:glycosyltransferase [Thermoanaerobaculia bacterium]